MMKLTTQSGRSMVEMLGVLAIIGVLSVGAIAGYSKAMMKYKLNKHAESYRMLLYEAMNMSKHIDSSTLTENLDLLPLLEKTNSIPSGLTKQDDTYTDTFGNIVWSGLAGEPKVGVLRTEMSPSDTSKSLCMNIANIAKENLENIYFFGVMLLSNPETGTDTVASRYYGNVIHPSFYNDTGEKSFLRSMTLNDMESACQLCNDNSSVCRVFIDW